MSKMMNHRDLLKQLAIDIQESFPDIEVAIPELDISDMVISEKDDNELAVNAKQLMARINYEPHTKNKTSH